MKIIKDWHTQVVHDSETFEPLIKLTITLPVHRKTDYVDPNDVVKLKTDLVNDFMEIINK